MKMVSVCFVRITFPMQNPFLKNSRLPPLQTVSLKFTFNGAQTF